MLTPRPGVPGVPVPGVTLRLVCVALLVLQTVPVQPLPATAAPGASEGQPTPRPRFLSGLVGRISEAGNAIGQRIETGAERIRERVHDRIVDLSKGVMPPKLEATPWPSKSLSPPTDVPAVAVNTDQPVRTTAVSQGAVVDSNQDVVVDSSQDAVVDSIPIANIIGMTTSAPLELEAAPSTVSAPANSTEGRNIIRAPLRCDPNMKPDSNGRCRDIY